MKKVYFMLIIFSSVVFSQKVSVVRIQQITQPEQGKFFYPRTNHDDSKIVFSGENYQGLWILNNTNGKLEKINDYYGAGYEPEFSDNEKIIFRTESFKNNKKFISIREFDIATRNENVLQSDLRNISQIRILDGEKINFSRNENLIELGNNKVAKVSSTNKPVVMIENSDLVLYRNGNRVVVNPNGDGNYLWASVSPDGEKLLYTFAGHGSFISDLEGNIEEELEYAHYPQWSPKGDWVLFMRDYDDGENVISSDLYLYNINEKKEFDITNTDGVNEMYPVWANSKDEVYCNSTNGIIYKIELKFN